MCKKKLIFKRIAFISLLIGVFVISGCGQSDYLPTETADNYVSEENNLSFPEWEDKAEDVVNDERSESLPKPLEIPVNTKAEDVVYFSEDGIDLLRAVHRCVSDGENIYFAYTEPDLYVMPIGANEHCPLNIENTEGMNVCNIAIDIYGKIHLLMADSNYDGWFIWSLDEEYKIDKIIDISAYFETKRIPTWFLIDKDGTYYFQWPINRDGIIVDSEGVLKHRLTKESLGIKWIYEAAVGKEGLIYLVYKNGNERLEIGELDVEKCSIKNEDSPLYFSSDEIFSAMSGGTDTNLLLFSPVSGVWAYDNKNGVIENRVPLSDIGFGSDTECWPLTFLPDGRLLLLGRTINDNHANDVLKYVPVGK